MIKYDGRLLERARELRREMTPQERKLWYSFLRTYPVKFYKQKIIDGFIVDFDGEEEEDNPQETQKTKKKKRFISPFNLLSNSIHVIQH